MGVEINKLGREIPMSNHGNYQSVPDTSVGLDSEPAVLHVRHAADIESTESTNTSTGELAGVYLGILNLYTTLPQFVGTGISMVVFSILEPGKSPELAKDAHPDEHHGTDGPNAIAVCLFIGALSSLGAAYATQRLKYVR